MESTNTEKFQKRALERTPEELRTGWVRYEKLRTLTPNQFSELYKKNLATGVPFDSLVDDL